MIMSGYARISIHALLAESDQAKALKVAPLSDFYPRSPCGERRSGLNIRCVGDDFYPRSPCGERPCRPTRSSLLLEFLSTLSLRRATSHNQREASIEQISIHALLAESDPLTDCVKESYTDFYPRSPCGERLLIFTARHMAVRVFLSTLSLRRATSIALYRSARVLYISIHALLAESDRFENHVVIIHNLFLSTLSLRRATSWLRAMILLCLYFYPRSPCGERP